VTKLHLSNKLIYKVKWTRGRIIDKILARYHIAAITFGYRVFVHTRFWERDAELYLHELVHVHQVEALGGLRRFLSAYITLFARQYIKTWSWTTAYQNHPFEVEAYAYWEQELIDNFNSWKELPRG